MGSPFFMLSFSKSATHHKLGRSTLTALHHADHVVSWGEVVDIQGQLTLPCHGEGLLHPATSSQVVDFDFHAALNTRGWEAGAYILVWTNDKGAPEGAPLTWIKLPD